MLLIYTRIDKNCRETAAETTIFNIFHYRHDHHNNQHYRIEFVLPTRRRCSCCCRRRRWRRRCCRYPWNSLYAYTTKVNKKATTQHNTNQIVNNIVQFFRLWFFFSLNLALTLHSHTHTTHHSTAQHNSNTASVTIFNSQSCLLLLFFSKTFVWFHWMIQFIYFIIYLFISFCIFCLPVVCSFFLVWA